MTVAVCKNLNLIVARDDEIDVQMDCIDREYVHIFIFEYPISFHSQYHIYTVGDIWISYLLTTAVNSTI